MKIFEIFIYQNVPPLHTLDTQMSLAQHILFKKQHRVTQRNLNPHAGKTQHAAMSLVWVCRRLNASVESCCWKCGQTASCPTPTVRWISAAAPRGNNFQTDQTLQQASSNNTAEWMTKHTLKSVTLRRCYISIVSFTTGHYVLLGPQSKLTWGEILFAASWPCESFNNNTFSLGVSGGRFTKPLSH